MDFNLEYRWLNEDYCDIYVNGLLILNMNHDEHGWAGMDSITKGFNRLASELDGTVNTTTEFE
jgi:hypothetical protein